MRKRFDALGKKKLRVRRPMDICLDIAKRWPEVPWRKGIPAVYKIKKREPRTEPCGTPSLTGTHRILDSPEINIKFIKAITSQPDFIITRNHFYFIC